MPVRLGYGAGMKYCLIAIVTVLCASCEHAATPVDPDRVAAERLLEQGRRLLLDKIRFNAEAAGELERLLEDHQRFLQRIEKAPPGVHPDMSDWGDRFSRTGRLMLAVNDDSIVAIQNWIRELEHAIAIGDAESIAKAQEKLEEIELKRQREMRAIKSPEPPIPLEPDLAVNR
jgi:hypothetical protein